MFRRSSFVAMALGGALVTAVPAVALEPVTDADFPRERDEAVVELGRLLFFDKVLSGNRNISCATCHHPDLSTGDGVALPLGEGPRGLGTDRSAGRSADSAVHARVPRNSPALFNLGAREFVRLFHDGRVESDEHGYYEGGFVTPAKWKLPTGLETLLAAQAMFPVGSSEEMAGQQGENPIADAAALNNMSGPGGVWAQLGDRLRAIPEYVERFGEAFPEAVGGPDDVTYVLAANAIAAFEADAFRSDDSPFDEFVRGDDGALTTAERHGMDLFYGKANCSSCHSGKFQTDHEFHAIAMVQIGPGKNDGRDDSYWRASGEAKFVEDFGRGRVTVRSEDVFKFRTPSLRNVELSGPWGHAGAYDDLRDVVVHHLDPVRALHAYEPSPGLLPEVSQVLETTASNAVFRHTSLGEARLARFLLRDTWVQRTPELRNRIAAANELAPRSLDEREIDDLVAFLCSLTDPGARDLAGIAPDAVPSGLPVRD
jgi:cytochrome c peroxidase